MPDLTKDLEVFQLKTNHYGFSGTRVEQLDASEYTLVTLVFDRSGSTSGFRDEMREAVDKIIDACKKSPRADNLMLRVCEFSDTLHERHGFVKLSSINKSDYDDLMQGGGGLTALYDAAENSVSATESYAMTLTQNDYGVNGIVFVMTDGMDNRSKLTPHEVKKTFAHAVSSEAMESLVSVLIGINLEPDADMYLNKFRTESGFTQYINIGDATPQKLAKLADFVSKSISSQSQSLGSGGPSQPIQF